MSLEVGQSFGRYRIVAALGAGGMGEVYRAHDSRLDRDVALKLLKNVADEAGAKKALLAEARAVSALNHPNVCTVHEVDEIDGQTCLVMELVDGRTLTALAGGRPLPIDVAARYGTQIAAALAHAHQRGIVHCDLKGANVIVTGDGTVKVLDFGIARRLTAQVADDKTRSLVTAERRGVVSGTLPYMPPERIRGGDADPRGDVWALGVVLFELLTGRRPFGGPTAADVSSAILQTPAPDLPSHVPKELRTIVERCLRKDAGERYQQAGEVRAALETAAEAAAPPRRRRLAVVPAGIAALLALVAAAGWVVTRPPPASTAIDSLAVLPFADLAPGPGSEYLADGVSDAMITELGQLGALRVTARTSSLRVPRHQQADSRDRPRARCRGGARRLDLPRR